MGKRCQERASCLAFSKMKMEPRRSNTDYSWVLLPLLSWQRSPLLEPQSHKSSMKLNARSRAKPGLLPQRHVRKRVGSSLSAVRGDRGSTAVEFAVILPVFLLLVFSLIDFGRYFYSRVVITNASIEVASAITRGLYTEGDSVTNKNQRITAVLDNVAPSIASFAQLQSSAVLNYSIPTACPNSAGTTTVEISSPFASISPITSFLSEVNSKSTMRCIR